MAAHAQPAAALSSSLQPVSNNERIEAVDIIRGVALFGILWCNLFGVWSMAGGRRGAGLEVLFTRTWLILMEGKFRSMYSFLFGLGFSLQLLRASAKGVPIVPVYLRRLAILFVIGVLHCILLFQADILQFYATMGLMLLLLRNRSPRTILILAGISLSVGLLQEWGILLRGLPASTWSSTLDHLRQDARTGSYAGMVRDRMGAVVWYLHPRNYYLAFEAESSFDGMEFCMFLLGMYAGRRGILRTPRLFRPLLIRILWFSFAIAVPLNISQVLLARQLRGTLAGCALYVIGRPAACLFYVAGLLLLLQTPVALRTLRFLIPAGRMGLTNYLLQSLAFSSLLYHYGLGLAQRTSLTIVPVALILGIYFVQLIVSHWWMRRFRWGPAEWLWRSLTYLKWQPIRPSSPKVT
jgi:uncharacterized protein